MPADRLGIHSLISYSTVGAVITNSGAAGCSATYNGIGDSTINLDRGVNANDCAILATIRGATIGSVRYVDTSDIAKQIICRDEAAGAMAVGERPIDVAIIKISAIDRKLVHAAGKFQGSAAGAAAALGQRGGVVTRGGVGIYNLVLDRPINASECVIIVTVGVGAGAAVDNHPQVVHTDDTNKIINVKSLVAGAAIDADISWAVFNLNYAAGERCYAIGSIAAAGGSVVGRGCLPVRNGAGDYQYPTDRNFLVGESVKLATVIGATAYAIRTVDALANRKDVETQVQAAAAQTNGSNGFVALRIA